jgi:transcriptional regulator with XRE-family HTH domain
MDLQAHLRQRLAETREARGMSVYQLARAAKVTPQYLGRIEAGERAPSLKVLETLAAVLDVEPAELLASRPSRSRDRRYGPDPLGLVQLRGAASRLKPGDLDLVLQLARRLGRAG